MQFCIFSDRYAIRILMMVYDRGTIISSDFKEISSNYEYIVKSALALVDQGLLEVNRERKSVRWSLTDRGKMLGSFFCLCHYFSHGWVECDELQAILSKLYDHRDGMKYKPCKPKPRKEKVYQ